MLQSTRIENQLVNFTVELPPNTYNIETLADGDKLTICAAHFKTYQCVFTTYVKKLGERVLLSNWSASVTLKKQNARMRKQLQCEKTLVQLVTDTLNGLGGVLLNFSTKYSPS
ncbi:hypothetical protein [Fluviispira vulneris]|uniref:hypothetical protein n=1 Tax=Fluviispira vulneris TaxID=2763012 RepID=UPI0016479175|nr:hypothetical protein [Fluviispira vulneris]